MKVMDSVALLNLRRDYDEKLEHERQQINRRERDLEEAARRAEKKAHRDAVAETALGLTKLRQQQQAKLHAHNKMHQAAEAEKMATAARAVQLATQHGQEVQKTKEKTKAEVEERAASERKAMQERHEEQMRRQAEMLNAAAERKLDEANELKRRETVRADKLQKELDAAKGEAKTAKTQVERTKKEKEEALRDAASKALQEKNMAIQAERDKAETARRTAAQAEAVRAEVVKLRSQQADEVTALATQALKVAEAEKEKAEKTWKQAELERLAHENARQELEILREEGQSQVEKANKIMADANEKIRVWQHAMDVQQAALDAVRGSAEQEKIALMKAAEESKAAALLAVAEERAAEKAAAEAAKAKKQASAALAKKLGVSSDAFTPPEDDDDDMLEPAPAASSHGDHAVLKQQLETALAAVETQRKRTARAEERASKLAKQITLLKDSGEVKTETALERRKMKSARESALEKGAALRRLREATSITVELTDEGMTKRALSIAGCDVGHADPPAKPTNASPAEAVAVQKMPSTMTVGVVAGVRIPFFLAEAAGFGSDSGSTAPEAVHVLIASQGGKTQAGTGVAVAVAQKSNQQQEWMVKYVLEDERVPSSSWMGEKEVTIASRWGVVVARGKVGVQARGNDVPASKRYDYEKDGAAVTRVQARARGRSARVLMQASNTNMLEAENHLKAVTMVQAATRGKLARQATKQLIDQVQKPMFIIATRRPLICRATHETTSERVGELDPDTRVFVLETHTMPDGSERSRVMKVDAKEPFGWLTSGKDGATSLSPVEVE